MELRHLRYLVGVADESSFVRAAERLHVAQPALSRQIRDLEEMLDTELVERNARGITLTPAGEACVTMARHILAEAHAAAERARLSSHGAVGRVTLAVGKRAVMTRSIGAIIAATREEHPELQLDVVELSFREQWDALRSATADIGLGIPAPNTYPDLVSETLVLDVYDHAVMAATHPLASRERISRHELGEQPIVWPDIAMAESLGRSTVREFMAFGVKADQIRSVNSHGSWLAFVRAGQGITFAPRSVLGGLPVGVVSVPLDGMAVSIPYSMITRRGDERPAVRRMLSTIRAAHALSGGTDDEERSPVPPGRRAHDRFELRHLRYFTTVVRQGTFGRAAEMLGITQPALSRQVRDLEREIGVSLLDRAARGVAPTHAGESFYIDALHVLQHVDRLTSEVIRARRGMEGRCVIGSVPTPLAVRVVARVVRSTVEERPDAKLFVDDIPTPRQPAALMDARIDLGVAHGSLGDAFHPEILRIPLWDDPMDTALLAVDHPLAGRRAVDARELVDTPFLFARRSHFPDFYDMVIAAARRAGIEPSPKDEYDGLETLWALVAEGRGWLLGAASQRRQPPPRTVGVPLTDLSVPWGAELLQRVDEQRPLVLRVAEIIRQSAASPSIVPHSIGALDAGARTASRAR